MKNIYKVILFVACFLQLNLKASVPAMLLRLEAAGQLMSNETVVYFDSSGTFGYNNLYDAPSLGVSPGYLNIITRLDSIDFQIKCLPLLTNSTSIPVKVVTGVSGSYQIYANEIQNLPSGACIMLHDNITNTDFDLRLGAYTCNISDTESVARFLLNITISSLVVTGSSLNPTCSGSGNGYIISSGAIGTVLWNYYWKDSLNNIVKTSLLKNTADTLFGLNVGTYKVDINTNGTCSNGTLTFSLQSTLSPIALYSTISDTLPLNEDGILFTNQSVNAGGFSWDFGDGGGASDTNAIYNYSAPGTYSVTLTAFGSFCADTSVYVKVITVVNRTTSIIKMQQADNHMVIGRDASNYYVQFNYNANVDAIISVSDLLGQVIDDITVKNVTNEKVYINFSYNINQLLFISAVSTVQERIFRKVVN